MGRIPMTKDPLVTEDLFFMLFAVYLNDRRIRFRDAEYTERKFSRSSEAREVNIPGGLPNPEEVQASELCFRLR